MTNLLCKIFVKNYKDISNPKVRNAYGILGSSVGIICNILLAISKIVVGLLSFSISVTADGFNNLSDAGSSFVSLFGFKLATKPADREHPFGHARIEYITGLIIAFIIIFLSFQLFSSSFSKIINPTDVKITYITLGVLVFSILVKFWMSFFTRSISKKIDSIPLKASATDALNDVITTSAVLISSIISMFSNLQIDGYIGILVALFILISGIKVIKETLNPLLGELPSKDVVSDICKQILSYKGVLGLHDLVIHNYGPSHFYVSVHVEVDAKINILKSHDMIDNIERDFLKNGVHLVIHLDPIQIDNAEINIWREDVKKILFDINPNLAMHDFRAVLGESHNNLIFDVVIPENFKINELDLTFEIDKKIKEISPKLNVVVSFDRNYVGLSSDK